MDIAALTAFNDNYIYLLRNGGHAAVVDPGDAEPVLRHLETSGDRLDAILVTHHHRDHTGGIAELLARHPAPIFGPARLDEARPLTDGEVLALPGLGLEFEVLHLPGHTRDHVAYYRRGTLFCGDTLFACGCGRLFEGTAAQLQASLARLAALPDDTLVYCGHDYLLSGLRFAAAVEPDNPALPPLTMAAENRRAAGRPAPPSSIEQERALNPFLRLRSPAVIAATTLRLGRTPAGEEEIFSVLRQWRDVF